MTNTESPELSSVPSGLAAGEAAVGKATTGKTSGTKIALIAGACAVMLLGTAGAGVAFVLQQRAAQEQSLEDAVTERNEAFQLAAQECGAGEGEYERLDGGEGIEFARVTKITGASYDTVWCFLESQGAPESLDVKIGRTRSLDGTREQAWGDFLATWTYHPDAGLNLLVERTDSPPTRE
ncbi:hypothetical protein ACXR2T_14410 [Leucobacter sp. HY1910]